MVKVRDFRGAVFNPQNYQQFLSRNIEHLEQIAMSKRFNTQQMIKQGHLKVETEPFIYIYKQRYQNHTSIGILAQISIEDYGQNKIKKHQKTLLREGLNHSTYLNQHVGPVVLSHRNDDQLNKLILKIVEEKPCFAQWETQDSRKHSLWKVSNKCSEIIKQFQKVECFYILDGHHRLEAAYQNYTLSQKKSDKEVWLQGLIYSCDYIALHTQHRAIQANPSNIEFLKQILSLDHIEITEFDDVKQQNFSITQKLVNYEIILKIEQKKYGINFKINSNDTLQLISAHRLQQQIFSLLDSPAPEQFYYVPGIISQSQLLKHQTIFFVRQPTIKTIFSLADEGITTPPKSTWFEPKPCSHMVIRLMQDLNDLN